MNKWLNEVKFLNYLKKSIELATKIGIDTEGQSMQEAYRKFKKYFNNKSKENN